MVLRETADGWVDLDGASYQPSGGRDLPRTTPNTRVLVLDQDGTGLALGGIAGTATDPRERRSGRRPPRACAGSITARPAPSTAARLRAGRDRPGAARARCGSRSAGTRPAWTAARAAAGRA